MKTVKIGVILEVTVEPLQFIEIHVTSKSPACENSITGAGSTDLYIKRGRDIMVCSI